MFQMEIGLQSIFTQMLNDAEIIETYSRIAKKEAVDGGYATHDLSHVTRVINNCEKIAQLLGMSGDDNVVIKIAALLHDIGCVSGSKGGHSERSAQWTEKYLSNKGLHQDTISKIVTAISEHSSNAKSVHGKILLFSDKIDINEKRIL